MNEFKNAEKMSMRNARMTSKKTAQGFAQKRRNQERKKLIKLHNSQVNIINFSGPRKSKNQSKAK